MMTFKVISFTNIPFSKSIGNEIGDAGATVLSESLKTNTSLTVLNLTRKYTSNGNKNCLSWVAFSCIKPIDNHIGDCGTLSLSETLKINNALTDIDLGSENKRKESSKEDISQLRCFNHF